MNDKAGGALYKSISSSSVSVCVHACVHVCLCVGVCLCAAEMQQLNGDSWFGRSGNGAPVRDARGNVLADYSSRRVSQPQQSILTAC